MKQKRLSKIFPSCKFICFPYNCFDVSGFWVILQHLHIMAEISLQKIVSYQSVKNIADLLFRSINWLVITTHIIIAVQTETNRSNLLGSENSESHNRIVSGNENSCERSRVIHLSQMGRDYILQ